MDRNSGGRPSWPRRGTAIAAAIVVPPLLAVAAVWYSVRTDPSGDGVPVELYEEGVLLGGSDPETAIQRVEDRVGLDLPIPRHLVDERATLLRLDSALEPGPFGVPRVRLYYDIWPRTVGEMLATSVGFNVTVEDEVVAWEEVDLGIEGVRARMLVDMVGPPRDVQIWAMRDGLQVSLRVRGPSVPDDVEVVKDAMRELMEE